MIYYRPATIDDGPELDSMALAIWIETFGHSAPPDDIAAYLAASYGHGGKLIRDLADPAVTFQLACDDEYIIGYAKLTEPFVDPALAVDALQLNQLYVASDWHGHGIADALMRWTTQTARDRGAKALVLTVWEENARARRFYERRGFVHVGDYAFPTGTQIDRDLIMRLSL
jgi:diamine N-acetyltransferase